MEGAGAADRIGNFERKDLKWRKKEFCGKLPEPVIWIRWQNNTGNGRADQRIISPAYSIPGNLQVRMILEQTGTDRT